MGHEGRAAVASARPDAEALKAMAPAAIARATVNNKKLICFIKVSFQLASVEAHATCPNLHAA
jgi:hypothetical protein